MLNCDPKVENSLHSDSKRLYGVLTINQMNVAGGLLAPRYLLTLTCYFPGGEGMLRAGV